MTRIVLVRHGESWGQTEGRHVGHDHCRGLSEHGRRQAAALADRLAGGELGHVDALLSSEMQRAVETARIIGPAIGFDEPVQDCVVCEIHPGEADGLTWAEVEQRWPTDAGTGWDPGVQVIGGAESWLDMHDRVIGALDTIAADHEGSTVVIATHGGVIAHTMFSMLGMPVDSRDAAWIVADNTSMTEFVLDPDLADWRAGRWGLRRFNDGAHLQALGPTP